MLASASTAPFTRATPGWSLNLLHDLIPSVEVMRHTVSAETRVVAGIVRCLSRLERALRMARGWSFAPSPRWYGCARSITATYFSGTDQYITGASVTHLRRVRQMGNCVLTLRCVASP